MPIKLTREELFKQVWERPMTKVAVDHGISDVALKIDLRQAPHPRPRTGLLGERPPVRRSIAPIFGPSPTQPSN